VVVVASPHALLTVSHHDACRLTSRLTAFDSSTPLS
jgi:hypothetical protein